MKFTLEATQWFKNGDHPNDYATDVIGLENGEMKTFTGTFRKENNWEGEVVRYFRHPQIAGELICPKCHQTMHVHGWIDQNFLACLKDSNIVCPSDWIVTDIFGRYYSCNPYLFLNFCTPC